MSEDVTLVAGTIIQHYDTDSGTWKRIPRVTSTGDTGSTSEAKEKTTIEDYIKRYGSGLSDGGDKNFKGQRIPQQTDGSEHAVDRDLQDDWLDRCKDEDEMQMRIIFPDLERAAFTWKSLGYVVSDASSEDWKMFSVSGKQNSTVTWGYADELTGVDLSGTGTLSVGEGEQLEVANTPTDAFWKVNQDTYESSDAAVVAVTKWGYVTGVSAGTATITVTRSTGVDGGTVTDTFEITVS